MRVNSPLVILIALLPVLAGAWYFLDRASSRREPAIPPTLTADAKAYTANLKLGGVEMKATENFTGAAVVEITGRITNAGDRRLSRVELTCVFFDPSGLVVLRERVPIVRATVQPGETKEFRLPFENIPTSWNQALPQLVIANIQFAP